MAPSLIRSELGENEIGNKIVHYFRVDSTNEAALKLAAALVKQVGADRARELIDAVEIIQG